MCGGGGAKRQQQQQAQAAAKAQEQSIALQREQMAMQQEQMNCSSKAQYREQLAISKAAPPPAPERGGHGWLRQHIEIMLTRPPVKPCEGWHRSPQAPD
jgi:hypothetical protein